MRIQLWHWNMFQYFPRKVKICLLNALLCASHWSRGVYSLTHLILHHAAAMFMTNKFEFCQCLFIFSVTLKIFDLFLSNLCSQCRARTHDSEIKSPLLYQLSQPGAARVESFNLDSVLSSDIESVRSPVLLSKHCEHDRGTGICSSCSWSYFLSATDNTCSSSW